MLRVSETHARTPYERLLIAVLVTAWKDAHCRQAHIRADALWWLHSDGCSAACEWLGLDVCQLRSRLTEGGGAGLRKVGRGVTQPML